MKDSNLGYSVRSKNGILKILSYEKKFTNNDVLMMFVVFALTQIHAEAN